MDRKPHKLTNEVGAPVENNDNSVTAGPRGPIAVQDLWLTEKISHFNREVIPERRMHAKGSGAYGTFTATHDISKYTKASVFEKGRKTDVFMRFSTVAGERGAAEAVRDIRGFAIKFYTEEGNWDLVGNNTPVFFIRDGHHFPDLNRVVKRDPHTNMHCPLSNWDFWTSLPEALHQVTILMSDRGIPASYRHMHGFGSHTYSMIDRDGGRVWVKFHFRTQQGIRNLTNEEAAAVIGMDRESHQRDLMEAIERGEFPRWTLHIQVMTEEQARNHRDNPFDVTKVWSKKEYPLIEVGVLELNRNPDNYFAEVEQSAFNPAHMVPGIGPSPDKLLQTRLFSYGDAQRYRLGVNNDQIPVNRARCPVNSYHRDGMMRVDGNHGATKAYTPNSLGLWEAQPGFAEPRLALEGDLGRYEPRDEPEDDPFYQPGDLFRLLTADEKEALVMNTKADMEPVAEGIKYRHAAHCYLADPAYGEALAAAMGLDPAKVVGLSELDHDARMRATAP
jgi:catalase